MSTSLHDQLPPYLGLGILDRNSITTHRGDLTARYLFGDELLYQITLNQKRCILEESFAGEFNGKTYQPALKEAFIHHLMAIPPYENKRFEQVAHRITEGRNIYIRFAGRGAGFIYFPAGYLFQLRLPLTEQNRDTWYRLKAAFEADGESALAKQFVEERGVLLRFLTSKQVQWQEIYIGICGAMLVDIIDVADLFWQSGVVLPEKEFRLTILDSSLSHPRDVLIQMGDMSRDFSTFAVCPTRDPYNNTEISIDDHIETFADNTIRFLVELGKQRPPQK